MSVSANLWWELPGPSAFVGDIVRKLVAGVNVILLVPDVCPGPIYRPILNTVRELDSLIVEEVRADEAGADSPAVFLRARLGLELGIATASDLVKSDRFRGRAVYVRGLSVDSWPAWKKFLGDYSSAAKALEEQERSSLCVEVDANTTDLPLDDVTLRSMRWHGVVGQLDMMLFALRLQSRATRALGPLLQQVHARSVAELSGADGRFAERLALLAIDELSAPEDLCVSYARERDWGPTARSSWSTGTLTLVDGEEVEHLALLASRPDFDRALNRRLWRAQVAVVFPLLETLRWQVIDRHRLRLRVPWKTQFRTVEHIADLELGDLANQLRRVAPTELVQALESLRDLRNKLAHLECLTYDELLRAASVRVR